MTSLVGFDGLWDSLLPIGRDPDSGGYRRLAWSAADLECRAWFVDAAVRRRLDVETDGNGNLWAWWGDPSAGDAVVVGSHLDSVPAGGAFDGPLGVVSAFAALDAVRERGFVAARPIAVAAFSDEEGARFGVACAGSRLLVGALDAERARALRDGDGTTMADAMRAAGHDPTRVGVDPERLARIGHFVELHVEQGRARPVDVGASTPRNDDPHGLVDLDAPVGVASTIWPHGRWRFEFAGRADHAGTTRLEDRDDPMLSYATAVLAARDAAVRHSALATFGKVRVLPNGVNAIPSHVTAWLDARGEDEARVRAVVADLTGGGTVVNEESWTPATGFDVPLRDRLGALLGGAPVLPTGAGHDAGILSAAGVPSAML
ncbi:MAG TPA: allantoate amidohydrolase, partial [Jiangellaceae bacterium]|nr:allantoate amidohydrolase [Jiangellaceae bacterium]